MMATLAKAKAACRALPVSLKVDDHRFLELTDRDGFEPAPGKTRKAIAAKA
jgi:hypothetical protein